MAERKPEQYTFNEKLRSSDGVWDTVFGLDPAPEGWSGRVLVYRSSGVPNPPIDEAVARAKRESAKKQNTPPDLSAGLPRGDKN